MRVVEAEWPKADCCCRDTDAEVDKDAIDVCKVDDVGGEHIFRNK